MNSIAPRALLAGDFRKSSFSTTGGDQQCVEVALTTDRAGVRDSKAPGEGTLAIPATQFGGFIARIQTGDIR